MNKVQPVLESYSKIEATDKRGRLLKKAVDAYLKGDDQTAINNAVYASQLWPKDPAIEKLKDSIKKEFPYFVSQMNLLPGVNLVEQKLQEALELIYDKKYVAAITACRQVLDLEPGNVLAVTRMGSAYWVMGAKGTARKLWQGAQKLDPGNAELQEFLKLKD